MTNRDEQREDWEEEFHGRFGNYWSKSTEGNVFFGRDLGQTPWMNLDIGSVKSFIHTLLQKERQKAESEKKALVEEVLFEAEQLGTGPYSQDHFQHAENVIAEAVAIKGRIKAIARAHNITP